MLELYQFSYDVVGVVKYRRINERMQKNFVYVVVVQEKVERFVRGQADKNVDF